MVISVKFNLGQLKLLFSTIFMILSIVLHALISSYPFWTNVTIIEYTKFYAKPRQSNLLSSCIQIIKTLLSKTHYTLTQVQTLGADSPSKLENTVNNNSYNLHQKSVPLLQLLFTCLFSPYFFITSVLQSPLALSSFIPQQFFIIFLISFLFQFSLFLWTGIRTIYIKSILPTSII